MMACCRDAGRMLQPGVKIKPRVTTADAGRLVHELYNFKEITVLELNGYDDCNFHIKVTKTENNENIWPHGYVLKIINELDSKDENLIIAQNEVLLYLGKMGIKCPQPVQNIQKKYYSKELGEEHIVRLLTFQPGTLLHQVPVTRELLYHAGQYVANLDIILQGYHHEAFKNRESVWMLKNCPYLKKFLFAVKNEDRQLLVSSVLETFEKKVLQKSEMFESGLIHADFNEQNILVQPTSTNGNWEVSGVLDFGDAHQSLYIFELAIAMCYLMLQVKNTDLIKAGAHIISGYTSTKPLSFEELLVLKVCVCARLCQSLVLGAYSYIHNADDYLLITSIRGWDLLSTLWNTPDEKVNLLWGIVNTSRNKNEL